MGRMIIFGKYLAKTIKKEVTNRISEL